MPDVTGRGPGPCLRFSRAWGGQLREWGETDGRGAGRGKTGSNQNSYSFNRHLPITLPSAVVGAREIAKATDKPLPSGRGELGKQKCQMAGPGKVGLAQSTPWGPG